jgi:hypothetical protein
MAPGLLRARCVAARAGALLVACLSWITCASAQQPNGEVSLLVQFRQGPPYPIVANAPNNGVFSLIVTGPPGAPFMIGSGPLNPGAASVFGSQLVDIGTPPFFQDVAIYANGLLPGAPQAYTIPASGTAILGSAMPPNQPLVMPPLQAAIADSQWPSGFALTAASQITFLPSKSILFIQGDFDPGVGPTCRLADTGPFGFSMLAGLLAAAGFSATTEVVDSQVTVDAQLLGPHGVVVLGSNRRVFTTAEVNALESFVRNGGGLVSYADATFGPGDTASDNQVLSRFGVLLALDNFGGAVFASPFNDHAISAGVASVGAEGVSLIEIVGNGIDVITNVGPCTSPTGPCAPFPGVAPSGSASPVYSTCVAITAGSGRVAVTFDRNSFFNPPGYGSCLTDASNMPFAVNLFLWAGGY